MIDVDDGRLAVAKRKATDTVNSPDGSAAERLMELTETGALMSP
jgi:threonine dehydrogenase-like Zn-dependent dehydrogenase